MINILFFLLEKINSTWYQLKAFINVYLLSINWKKQWGFITFMALYHKGWEHFTVQLSSALQYFRLICVSFKADLSRNSLKEFKVNSLELCTLLTSDYSFHWQPSQIQYLGGQIKALWFTTGKSVCCYIGALTQKRQSLTSVFIRPSVAVVIISDKVTKNTF